MRDETLAIHAGYSTDPTTHAVATPIYQTVAYEFDSAQHGADSIFTRLEQICDIKGLVLDPFIICVAERREILITDSFSVDLKVIQSKPADINAC